MNDKNVILEYLNTLSLKEKEALGKLRDQILKISPNLEERLSRGVPFFYYLGKRVVGFRSSQKHLSFFIMEGNVFKDLQQEILDYDYSSTVIRFKPENPIPEKLIEKLVKARISEIETKQKANTRK